MNLVDEHVARLVHTTQHEGAEVGKRYVLDPPSEPLQQGSLGRLPVDDADNATTFPCNTAVSCPIIKSQDIAKGIGLTTCLMASKCGLMWTLTINYISISLS